MRYREHAWRSLFNQFLRVSARLHVPALCWEIHGWFRRRRYITGIDKPPSLRTSQRVTAREETAKTLIHDPELLAASGYYARLLPCCMTKGYFAAVIKITFDGVDVRHCAVRTPKQIQPCSDRYRDGRKFSFQAEIPPVPGNELP